MEKGMESLKLNFENFAKVEMMTMCGAFEDPGKQKTCRFYEKSSGLDKCMYCVMGNKCDNHLAQKDARDVLGGVAMKKQEETVEVQPVQLTQTQPENPVDSENKVESPMKKDIFE